MNEHEKLLLEDAIRTAIECERVNVIYERIIFALSVVIGILFVALLM